MGKYSLAGACLALAMSACAQFVVAGDDAAADAQAAAQDATLRDAQDAPDGASDAPLGDVQPLDAMPDRVETGPKACPGALIECNGKCIACAVDASDSQNRVAVCGADGGCATECKASATLCGPVGDAGAGALCVNLDTDPSACGSCTQRCGNGSSVAGQCNAGKCVPTAIASVSSADSALIVSPSDGMLLFHKDNQVQRCALPTCANAAPLTNSTAYTATTAPYGITTAASPPMVFYAANELTDAGTNVAFIARCMNILSCPFPIKHLVRSAFGIAGDSAGLYLADGTWALQKIDVGIVDAATPVTTATSAISRPVLTSTHVYYYQPGSGIYRCPRSSACTPEKVVATSAMVNMPYDVVNDTLFYADNSATAGAVRVLSCSVATTPASCDPTKVKVLASGLPAVGAVTADSRAVYFTNKGVSVCTDLVNGCTGPQLAGYVTADAELSGSVRVVGEFVYWVQANADAAKSINVMRAHVPY